MKILKSIIYVLLSGVVCYLAWLIFYFLTPYIMNMSWFWMIVLFFVLGGSIIPLIGFLPGLFAAIINTLKSGAIIEKIFCVLIGLLFAFDACRLAWIFDIDYGFKQIVFSIMQNLIVVGLFWGLLSSFIMDNKE